jgi:hypothetical protein
VWAQSVAALVSLYFRLIRVGSLRFAYYRVNFLTQVKDGGD